MRFVVATAAKPYYFDWMFREIFAIHRPHTFFALRAITLPRLPIIIIGNGFAFSALRAFF
jgi:hypothetical protein